MIQVSIFLNEVITNQAQFSSQEEAEAWVAYHGFSSPVYEDISAQVDQDKINAEARAYLASTDWYVVRQAETGVAVPQSILDARAAARASIV
jgi:hypothetical protein